MILDPHDVYTMIPKRSYDAVFEARDGMAPQMPLRWVMFALSVDPNEVDDELDRLFADMEDPSPSVSYASIAEQGVAAKTAMLITIAQYVREEERVDGSLELPLAELCDHWHAPLAGWALLRLADLVVSEVGLLPSDLPTHGGQTVLSLAQEALRRHVSGDEQFQIQEMRRWSNSVFPTWIDRQGIVSRTGLTVNQVTSAMNAVRCAVEISIDIAQRSDRLGTRGCIKTYPIVSAICGSDLSTDRQEYARRVILNTVTNAVVSYPW